MVMLQHAFMHEWLFFGFQEENVIGRTDVSLKPRKQNGNSSAQILSAYKLTSVTRIESMANYMHKDRATKCRSRLFERQEEETTIYIYIYIYMGVFKKKLI